MICSDQNSEQTVLGWLESEEGNDVGEFKENLSVPNVYVSVSEIVS